jgi:hypothetical protein
MYVEQSSPTCAICNTSSFLTNIVQMLVFLFTNVFWGLERDFSRKYFVQSLHKIAVQYTRQTGTWISYVFGCP